MQRRRRMATALLHLPRPSLTANDSTVKCSFPIDLLQKYALCETDRCKSREPIPSMTQGLLLPLVDYQRIYQVIYSVLQASEIATTHRACIFFAGAGALILREHYGLRATFSAGAMAMMVDEETARVAAYGRIEEARFVSDKQAFHAWVECDGWLIDFMAPIMGVALRESGHDWQIPRLMLQKPLAAAKAAVEDIQHVGDFVVHHDRSLAQSLVAAQSDQFEDLLTVCLAWFRRPPKSLNRIAMADSRGARTTLAVNAPLIDGVW